MPGLSGARRRITRDRPLSSAEFAVRIDPLVSGGAGRRVAVAVSGGPDSTALLLLARDWASAAGASLSALTVDHRLRPGSGAEASSVASLCRALGVPHTTLVRHGAAPRTGVQARARRARLDLLTGWCRANGVSALLLAHHLEDQAETVLLRTARNTGPEGLAAMAPTVRRDGVDLVRPMLDVPPARLRATCAARGVSWIDDPSNRDRRFARVRLRDRAAALAGAGLTPERLGRLAAAMGGLRRHLDRITHTIVARHGRLHEAGWLTLDLPAFLSVPEPLRAAILGRLLAAVAPGYPPRSPALARLVDRIPGPSGTGRWTLGHCRIWIEDGRRLVVAREPRFCAPPVVAAPDRRTRWDGRFEVAVHGPGPLLLGALGERGWSRLCRIERGLAEAARMRGIPPEARAALPLLRDLDGGYFVPHLSVVGGWSEGRDRTRVMVSYAPDVSWVAYADDPSRPQPPDAAATDPSPAAV